MKRIRVPDELLNFATKSCANTPAHQVEAVAISVLRYISEHPQVPTDAQARELSLVWNEGAKVSWYKSIENVAVEWQRRCFQEEPEIPAEIEDLLWKPHGTYISDEQLKIVESQCSRHNDALSEAYRRGRNSR